MEKAKEWSGPRYDPLKDLLDLKARLEQRGFTVNQFDQVKRAMDALGITESELFGVYRRRQQTQANPMQLQVREFMEKMRQHRFDSGPKTPPQDVRMLRFRLLWEESHEACEAMLEQDLVNVARELADVLYVTFGAAEAYGLSMQPLFDELHRSNLEKDPNVIDEHGKVIKSEGWKPPDIEGRLLAQVKEAEGHGL